MDTKKNNGFTIIETTLVLSISSLLLILMLTGITLAVQQQRFSDSVNGSQSFIQRQFNSTQNILNNRPNGTCNPDNPGTPSAGVDDVRGSSACLVLGKLLDIQGGADESTITSYDVIAEDVDVQDAIYDDFNDLELISSIHPTAIEPDNTEYIVPWGARVSDIRDAGTISGPGSGVRYIALLRSPKSGVIHVYRIGGIIDVNPLSFPAALARSKTDTDIREITEGSVKMCLSSIDLANFNAMLEIIPSGSQDGIVTHFDDSARETYECA